MIKIAEVSQSLKSLKVSKSQMGMKILNVNFLELAT